MSSTEKKTLNNLNEKELSAVYARAAKIRKAALRKEKNLRHSLKNELIQDDSDNLAKSQKTSGQVEDELDFWAQKALQKLIEENALDNSAANLKKGMIIQISSGAGLLKYENETLEFQLRQDMSMVQKTDLAVCDNVIFETTEEGHNIIQYVLPRTQILSRPDPTKPEIERVVAVNMDLILIVASVKTPKFNPGLIDRFLLAAQQTNAEIAICLNKFDLIKKSESKFQERLKTYKDIGIKVLFCSAETGYGIDEFKEFIYGKKCVFLGNSGVGKSSLINAICGDLNLRTNAPRRDGKGRHTTTFSRLYEIDGFEFIDTPGIREFSTLDIEKHELHWYFKEFQDYLPCKFNDCIHLHEIKCNVKQAVEDGKISESRYKSYLNILNTLS